MTELIQKFRKLNENRLAYTKIGYMKNEKFNEAVEKVKSYTFKPKISELSQAIERYHTERFLREHPIDLDEPAPSKTDPRDKFDSLINKVKGIDDTLHNKSAMSKSTSKSFDKSFDRVTTEKDELNTTSQYKSREQQANLRIKMLYKKQELAKQKIEEQRKQRELEVINF